MGKGEERKEAGQRKETRKGQHEGENECKHDVIQF